MADPFLNMKRSLESPATKHYVVTPGAAVLDPLPRVLYANSDGTMTVEDEDGTSVVYNVGTGSMIPFRGTKITAATAQIIAWT